MPKCEMPERLKVAEGAQECELTLVGPSHYGWVYRATKEPLCCRVVPLHDAPLELRHECHAQIGMPAPPHVARVSRTWHDASYFFMSYDIPQMKYTLAEALLGTKSRDCVRHLAEVLRAVPGWWASLYFPLLLTPADIAFSGDDAPLLCAWPKSRPPRMEMILAVPELTRYLASQFIRGNTVPDARVLDLYALGVTVLQCVQEYAVPEDPHIALPLAARSDRALSLPMRDDLPLWLHRVEATQEVVRVGRRLASVASEVDLGGELRGERRRNVPLPAWVASELDLAGELCELAAQLERSAAAMDPRQAGRELRDRGEPREAYALLQDALLPEEPAEAYELLMLTAEIASQNLGRVLEAVDLYERAIQKNPENLTSYEGQFRVIAAGRHHRQFQQLNGSSTSTLRRLDAMIRRDFERMPEGQQALCELQMAEYLIWRGLYVDAMNFIYPRLFNQANQHCWSKLDLNLSYGKALAGASAWPQLEMQLAVMRVNVERCAANGVISEGEQQHWRETIRELASRMPSTT